MTLTLRAYNVLFGDAILASWEEDDGEHHAWIDFGNFHNDPNAVFETVYQDVLERTRGTLDLVVVTHRHLDHLEGFSMLRTRFARDFTIERLWHAHVTPQTDRLFKVTERALRGILPHAVLAGGGEIGRIWRNNFGDLALSTQERMDGIRREMGVPAARTFAIHRGVDLAASRALPPGAKRLKIQVCAPEEDSGVYLRPLEHALRLRGLLAGGGSARRLPRPRSGDPFGARGVAFADSPRRELADFARLRRQLRSGGLDLLAAVDTTRNNTSIVMRWTYGQTRLLFTGDAEETSWEVMRKNRAPLEAQAVKVGHHGSINASPPWAFTAVLPRRRAGNAAIISTEPSRFTGENEVPKGEVVEGWRRRLTSGSRLLRTDRKPLGKPVIIQFPG
jgi:hypothetical protein